MVWYFIMIMALLRDSKKVSCLFHWWQKYSQFLKHWGFKRLREYVAKNSLDQLYPVQNSIPYSSKARLNIILQYAPRTPKWYLPVRVSNLGLVYGSTVRATSPTYSHRSWFSTYLNNAQANIKPISGMSFLNITLVLLSIQEVGNFEGAEPPSVTHVFVVYLRPAAAFSRPWCRACPSACSPWLHSTGNERVLHGPRSDRRHSCTSGRERRLRRLRHS
jgi:hypothetical protein